MKAEALRTTLDRTRVPDLLILTKPGITLMVLVSTAVGYHLAAGTIRVGPVFVHLLAGTALLAAGTGALNMWIERRLDARMRRTEQRPLPAGRLSPAVAAPFGVALSVAGLGWLALETNLLVAGLGALTAAVYLFAYTPMKRVSTMNTLVGGISGALPPMMGWAAASGRLDPNAAVLFCILFFWQLPHFLAIAWRYREDYARAGMKMLPVEDPEGVKTAGQVVLQTTALVMASVTPFLTGMADSVYLAGALVLGTAFLGFGVGFAVRRTPGRARALFLASIVYLPLLLGLLVFRGT